jgi:hypothetical protein
LGNVNEFHTWLERAEAKQERKCSLIVHTTRFNDLQVEVVARNRASDDEPLFVAAHPLWVVYAQYLDTGLFPDSRLTLHLSPLECLALYRTLLQEVPADDQQYVINIVSVYAIFIHLLLCRWRAKLAALAPGGVLAPASVGDAKARARALITLTYEKSNCLSLSLS